jgi:predicted nucleotide-binding protein (sugar kinase/HSP70/actin superfamily)
MITIGIPRALLYYQYYPLWQTFFTSLGARVVLSTPTTQTMLAQGSSLVITETCLPVKVFLGHVAALSGHCDCVFIPALRSTKRRVYNCAKFLGLPDLARAVLPGAPPIIDMGFDVNRGQHYLYQEVYRLGRRFNWNPLKVREAALAAWAVHRNYHELMAREQLMPPQALARMYGTVTDAQIITSPCAFEKATIAVVGHPYLIYDEHINHRLMPRLARMGYRTLTAEMLPITTREQATVEVMGGSYWTYEDEVVGAGGHYLAHQADGVIGVMAFSCGPDSLMMDVVHRRASHLRQAAFMSLTLEEHTAEAGVITRLEAFLDMVERKKRGSAAPCS